MLESDQVAAEGAARFLRPGRLWSLLEVMRALDLDTLVTVGHDQRYARDRYFDKDNPPGTLSDANKEHVKTALTGMADICESIGATEMHTYLSAYVDEIPNKHDIYDTLCRAFWSAVESKWVIFLDKREREFLTNKAPFGADVQRAFPNSQYDIEFASRSLAFGLSTAAVFHLMRAMESAVSAMAQKLGVTNTEVEWGKILGPMDDKIKLMPAGPDKKKWSEARADLWHVKECWRNETMHPRRFYTQEQGEEIFRAVKTFMVHLASLLAPPPKPKAAPAKAVAKKAP